MGERRGARREQPWELERDGEGVRVSGRWRRLIDEAWASARRGRHAQGLRMARAAAGALERRGDGPAAARAWVMLARLQLERGETATAIQACDSAEAVLEHVREPGLITCARLWRAWAAADAGDYARAHGVAGAASLNAGRDPEGPSAAAAWAVSTACGLRSGVTAGTPAPGDEAWTCPEGSPFAPLLVAAWAVRVEWSLAHGEVFRAGSALAALRRVATVDPTVAVEVALAQLRLAAATGDAPLVASAAAESLRRADSAHLPWARLRALAAWRDATARLVAPEAGILRVRVRRVAARSPVGWRDAVRGEDTDGDGRTGGRLPSIRRPEPAPHATVPGLVGESLVMRALRAEIIRAARTPFPVLIEGESGSGKELVARGLHTLSPRADKPFRDVNCAALADELVDAELFGHARGAFTGAVASRAGLIEEASGGTLFLDEVADLSPRAQARLLRTLQEQEVRRVGEVQGRAVDLRVVSACNRLLDDEVAVGRFRPDLVYRLAAIRIRVPPLRDRPGDIPLLVSTYWPALAAQVGTRAAISPSVLAALASYHWPGNVRELQHALVRLAIRAPATGSIGLALLPEGWVPSPQPDVEPLTEARGRFEREYVQTALARHGDSRAATARALGLSRQGLRKVLARTGAR